MALRKRSKQAQRVRGIDKLLDSEDNGLRYLLRPKRSLLWLLVTELSSRKHNCLS